MCVTRAQIQHKKISTGQLSLHRHLYDQVFLAALACINLLSIDLRAGNCVYRHCARSPSFEHQQKQSCQYLGASFYCIPASVW